MSIYIIFVQNVFCLKFIVFQSRFLKNHFDKLLNTLNFLKRFSFFKFKHFKK